MRRVGTAVRVKLAARIGRLCERSRRFADRGNYPIKCFILSKGAQLLKMTATGACADDPYFHCSFWVRLRFYHHEPTPAQKARIDVVLPENTRNRRADPPELFGRQGKALQDKREVPTNTFHGRVQTWAAQDF